MSCCYGCVPQEVRPGTARVLVTELSGSGQINPTPIEKPCEDTETSVGFDLSPEKLKLLCGTEDLADTTSLEICVDTQVNTLGNFGAYLPKLVLLKMNDSMIMSVRDLGTTLSHLQVLWMCHCCLKDLEGIAALSSLKELYVAYNKVSDLSQISLLENLNLLDLEGNVVDDLVQVQYLGFCGNLKKLTLTGNPVCVRPNPTASQWVDYSYRASVRELVPQLRYLDDVSVEEESLSCSSVMGEDWTILQNATRECNYSQSAVEEEETADGACPPSRPSTARCLASSHSLVWPCFSTGFKPHTSARPMSATLPGVLTPPGSRPGSAGSDPDAVEAESSILTHGAGKILFCGNPVRAIRERREKLRTAPTRSTFNRRDLPIHVPEHTYDLEDPDVGEREDIFSELRAWREENSKRLQAIETERLPQILAIHHEKEEDDEGFSGMKNDSGDDEEQLEKHDLSHSGTLSPDVASLSLSSDSTMSPSPPPNITPASDPLRPQGIRLRRLRLSQVRLTHLPDHSGVGCFPGTETRAGDTSPTLQRFQQVPPLPQAAHIPRPPLTNNSGAIVSCVEPNASSGLSDNKFQKCKDRPVIIRPHTARAVLQKHAQHNLHLSCRGSSQPD